MEFFDLITIALIIGTVVLCVYLYYHLYFLDIFSKFPRTYVRGFSQNASFACPKSSFS